MDLYKGNKLLEYKLKNGKVVNTRKAVADDAEAIINIISAADAETNFLARNPGEFCISEEQEKIFISKVHENTNEEMFVAEIEGKTVGQCSVGIVRNTERCKHRAEVTFVILKDYCGMGIGGKLMQECIHWCKNKNVTQIELTVVADNRQAITMYKSFGFKKTGTIPKALRYKDGTFADEQLMVLEI